MDHGGSYEWKQDGHSFFLILDSLSYDCDCSGKYRLFINGIDVETSREFSSVWRRKGLKMLIIGIIVMTFMIFKIDSKYFPSLAGINFMAGFGIFQIVSAVVLLSRYSKPKTSPSAQAYKTNYVTV